MDKLKLKPICCGNDIMLRLIEADDLDKYYKDGFEHEDKEVMLCTGSTSGITREQLAAYINRIVTDNTRYDLLIINKEKNILGEVVLNQIDWETKCSSFRIGLFKMESCNRGLGELATKEMLKLGFEALGLHRIELEVFAFNVRAFKCYSKCGFIKEGVLRDAHMIEPCIYCNVICMSILSSDYFKVSE